MCVCMCVCGLVFVRSHSNGECPIHKLRIFLIRIFFHFITPTPSLFGVLPCIPAIDTYMSTRVRIWAVDGSREYESHCVAVAVGVGLLDFCLCVSFRSRFSVSLQKHIERMRAHKRLNLIVRNLLAIEFQFSRNMLLVLPPYDQHHRHRRPIFGVSFSMTR